MEGKEGERKASLCVRTDLACEAGRGEEVEENACSLEGGITVHVHRCRGAQGGRYVTVFCGKVTLLGERGKASLSRFLSGEIRLMAEQILGRPLDASTRILVAGLGNPQMTADAVGPEVLRRTTPTRHLKAHDAAVYHALGSCELSMIAPGVLGQTGIESGVLVKGAVDHVKPHLLVAVDALAARSCERLASTFQLSDTGLSPGAGVGNFRLPMNRESMGCPVMGVGVPTVVDSSTLVLDALERAQIPVEQYAGLMEILENGRSFVVSPKDCDEILSVTCRILAGALDHAFGVGEL